MKVDAYGAIYKPSDRAVYDRTHGFSLRHLARAIGDDSSWWATAWVVAWSIVAVLFFLGGPELAARIIGSRFAPGFDEIIVRHPAADNCFGCTDTYTREFVSSSGFFRWLLNSLLIWALLPAIAVAIGMTLRTASARSCGFMIAFVRRYTSDSWIRAFVLVVVAVLPIVVAFAIYSAAPDAVPLPGG